MAKAKELDSADAESKKKRSDKEALLYFQDTYDDLVFVQGAAAAAPRSAETGQPSHLGSRYVLLDNQATVHLFADAALLTAVRDRAEPERVAGVGGGIEAQQEGDFGELRGVLFSPEAVVSVLSFSRCRAQGCVLDYDGRQDAFTMTTPGGAVMVFQAMRLAEVPGVKRGHLDGYRVPEQGRKRRRGRRGGAGRGGKRRTGLQRRGAPQSAIGGCRQRGSCAAGDAAANSEEALESGAKGRGRDGQRRAGVSFAQAARNGCSPPGPLHRVQARHAAGGGREVHRK